MNPADLTLPTISPTLTNKTLATPQSNGAKNGASRTSIPRVDLEPIYTQLKSALGDLWTEYKTAVNAFVCGNISQAELSWVLAPVLSPAPALPASADLAKSPVSTLHLHNTLVTALFVNAAGRDLPPQDVAPWVVATDKVSTGSKNAGTGVGGDRAEERLKKEVMGMHARDRRRIKGLKEGAEKDGVGDGLRGIKDYHYELAVKAAKASTRGVEGGEEGGLSGGRSGWDLESRRRYAQPLASETLEFPTVGEVQARIEPIATESGLVGGTQSSLQVCAEFLVQAAENYLKEKLGSLLQQARSNGEDCIQTAKFRKQLWREEEDIERGALQKHATGLLPVQMEVLREREPLSLQDIRLGFLNNDPYLRQDPFARQIVWDKLYPEIDTGPMSLQYRSGVTINGVSEPDVPNDADAMAVEDDMYWQGSGVGQRDELMGVLDGCLIGDG
ncbi:Transcriptional regulator of RNA polII, SAGA, subunit [Teratosphaeria destructans]|uniref:Transcriptional regulator of RNA polII, SAGA, subunit n=1 Tax=Teratosphaeria destructans TaxID=418781 RepID=A0A9W7ST85_9PEZI|nr:Transcriptional regulator of RNA polII, SAGA, subunit [Teratosphaeria destructans]